MSSPAPQPRPIDHLVLPTADLATARARLSLLGFTVAPDGVHPFGTRNCCVYFADGTFIEPLAVADSDAAAEAAQVGNGFILRDRLYRSRNGDEGLSALVVTTEDARADHARFVQEDISAAPMLAFSRPFVAADGKSDEASFLLAFAADASAPDCFFFACERVNAPRVDRSALQRHRNGVTSIARVVLSAPDPAHYGDFLRQVTNGAVSATADGLRVAMRDAEVAALDHSTLQTVLGCTAKTDDALRLRAIAFRTADLAAVEALLAEGSVAFERRGGVLIVAPAAGQGAHFIFETSQ